MDEIQPDHLENYMGIGPQEITRLVLCLLIEEAIKKQLAPYRPGSGAIDLVAPTLVPPQFSESSAKRARLKQVPLSPVKVVF